MRWMPLRINGLMTVSVMHMWMCGCVGMCHLCVAEREEGKGM